VVRSIDCLLERLFQRKKATAKPSKQRLFCKLILGNQDLAQVRPGACGRDLAWDEHDSFSLPSWRWHQHKNRSKTDPSILFSITDRPLLQMTGLDREESE